LKSSCGVCPECGQKKKGGRKSEETDGALLMKKVETITTGSEKFKTPEKMRIYQATTSSYNKECPADSPYHVKREIIMSS
jgi:hypothetical protein